VRERERTGGGEKEGPLPWKESKGFGKKSLFGPKVCSRSEGGGKAKSSNKTKVWRGEVNSEESVDIKNPTIPQNLGRQKPKGGSGHIRGKEITKGKALAPRRKGGIWG